MPNALAQLKGARRAEFPRPYAPMLPTLTREVFQRAEWLYEPKFDGYRVLAFIDNREAHLWSRNLQDYSQRYPEVTSNLTKNRQMILDGEIVALGPDGRLSFQRLQNRTSHPDAVIKYYVFDVLYLDGYDLSGVALHQRKQLLHDALQPNETIEEAAVFDDGLSLFHAAQANGLEGIVAKQRDSLYESGRRVRTWLKIKTAQADEFVVAGYTTGTGWRSDSLGSLILGSYDERGKLKYAGHVGTGFDANSLDDMLRRLRPVRTTRSPFDEPIPKGGGSSRTGAKAIWVEPRVVVEVKYAERTDDGKLRHPVFLRVREDKPAVEVHPQQIAEEPVDQISVALQALDNDRDRLTIHLDGHDIRLTSLNKVLWPAWEDRRALTKRDLVRYYLQIAPFALPHLRDRPVTMTRFPDGIKGQKFYQKSPKNYAPPFVERFVAFSEHNNADDEYFVCNNVATLVWLAQVADLELHVTHTRITAQPDAPQLRTIFSGSLRKVEHSSLNYPDYLVIDLDPYIYSGTEPRGAEPELNREGFRRACEAAIWFRELLASIGIAPFLKTTGKTGLHLYVPIARTLDYDSVRAVAETLARQIVALHPGAVTTEWSVPARTGKVFLDYNMNRRSASLAAPYSPRAVDFCGVSTPISWDELERVYPTQFTMLNVAERLRSVGDLWRDILTARTDLARLA
jgi:bifunctional non-homologous end joining protein LigD